MSMRLGLLGAGRIGQVHADAVAMVTGADLVAVADPVDAAARLMAASLSPCVKNTCFGVSRKFESQRISPPRSA